MKRVSIERGSKRSGALLVQRRPGAEFGLWNPPRRQRSPSTANPLTANDTLMWNTTRPAGRHGSRLAIRARTLAETSQYRYSQIGAAVCLGVRCSMRKPVQKKNPFAEVSKRMKQADVTAFGMKDVATWFSAEGPDEDETDVGPYAESYGDDPNFRDVNWLEVFRALDAAGAGKLVLGRHGHQTRFAWLEGSSRYVAQGCVSFPQPPDQSLRRRTRDEPVFWTRHAVGRTELLLPRDVSKAELVRLASYVSQLKGEKSRKGSQ